MDVGVSALGAVFTVSRTRYVTTVQQRGINDRDRRSRHRARAIWSIRWSGVMVRAQVGMAFDGADGRPSLPSGGMGRVLVLSGVICGVFGKTGDA